MAGLRRHTRFYALFHFYFSFFYYNHLAIFGLRGSPHIILYSAFHSVYTQPSFGVWRIGRAAICTAKEKKIPERHSLYSPAYGGSCVVGLDHGSAVGKRANGKKAPRPSLFLSLSGARGLCYALIQLFYSNKEGWRHWRMSYNIREQRGRGGEQGNGLGWAGLDWIGVGHFGNGRGSLVLSSWVGHGPPAFGHFFII
ncbi:hypothetical protein V8C34DRAFT_256839 [Trichoderma compactum]